MSTTRRVPPMKRIVITALLAALMVLPATAFAKRGHRVHRHGGQVGTVTSFDSATGELVITTTKGREISGLVTDDTHLQCNKADDDADATASHHGDDDEPGDDNGDDADDDAGDDHGNGADDDADDDHGNGADDDADDDNGNDDGHGHQGHHGHHSSKCTTDALVAGAQVLRARIDLSGDDAVWTKLKIAPATS
jgi:hypothetical protein